jgi:hypothetical protein
MVMIMTLQFFLREDRIFQIFITTSQPSTAVFLQIIFTITLKPQQVNLAVAHRQPDLPPESLPAAHDPRKGAAPSFSKYRVWSRQTE